MPVPGTVFSASVGVTLDEGAAGVPHGNIRWTTAGQIRANGGRVIHVPERDPKSAMINQQHVHVVEGGETSAFSEPQPNPVPRRKRFGGPDYREARLSSEE
jgi:hypothetical protein